MIDKHTIALISIIGCSLDLLGTMYLAYDLLGGEHGPLRTLTRTVTYGVLFGIGYGLGLGAIFGLAAGVTAGITLGWEFSRAAKHQPKPGDLAMSAIRAAGYGLGVSLYLWPQIWNRIRHIEHGRSSLRVSSAVFGLIRYSTIVTAGPSVTSASISTIASGQCNEGVSGKFVLPARRYRHAAARWHWPEWNVSLDH